MNEKISVIMPAYNAADYIAEAIHSVIDQSYPFWELIIVNDGSTDATGKIVRSFNDDRIEYYVQANKGVSAARNLALEKMTGDFFCFLDADDVLPYNSIESRLKLFRNHKKLIFADGKVNRMNETMSHNNNMWSPNFSGNPFDDLVKLEGRSFFGLTWLIKREVGKHYRFEEGIAHGEDLLFYMELARQGGEYAYTTDVVLHYRDTPASAMKDLEGLERGYRSIEKIISDWKEVSPQAYLVFKIKYKKFMFLSYFRAGKWRKASNALINF